MNANAPHRHLHPAWWTVSLIAVLASALGLCLTAYTRAFIPRVIVTLSSDRSGLVMEVGSKVKMRGVDVGRVRSIVGEGQHARLLLEIDTGQVARIPANVEPEIKATTAFGNKYVDLVYPEHPSPQRVSSGQTLHSRNVGTEVNTVFESVVKLLSQIDPGKLNAVLTTLADGLRGQGATIGEAISAADRVLTAVNARADTVRQDFRGFASVSDTYADVAQDLLATLNAASTTSTTITDHASDLDALLLNAIGLAHSGTQVIGDNKDSLVLAVNTLKPTTDLLLKYNPEYTCTLVGAKWFLDHGGYYTTGGHNGYSLITDSAVLLANDPYVYPDNLPIVAAKGGPGGKPGCGSLPDVTKNFPVRQLVTNTGWGTGMDIRPNPGLGHPCWANYFPVTRAVPEGPSIRCQGPPSPGLPVPAPGPLPPPSPAADRMASPSTDQPAP